MAARKQQRDNVSEAAAAFKFPARSGPGACYVQLAAGKTGRPLRWRAKVPCKCRPPRRFLLGICNDWFRCCFLVVEHLGQFTEMLPIWAGDQGLSEWSRRKDASFSKYVAGSIKKGKEGVIKAYSLSGQQRAPLQGMFLSLVCRRSPVCSRQCRIAGQVV